MGGNTLSIADDFSEVAIARYKPIFVDFEADVSASTWAAGEAVTRNLVGSPGALNQSL